MAASVSTCIWSPGAVASGKVGSIDSEVSLVSTPEG